MYFRSDIRKLLRSRITQLLFLAMLFVMVLDPVSIIWRTHRYTEFSRTIGAHPFQFWLLIQSASWGNRLYNTLFWAFTVLPTGLIYLYEQRSSIGQFLIIRRDKYKYLLAKIFSAFVFVFAFFMLLFLINLAVTFSIFSMDAPITAQYRWLIPREGTLAHFFYESGPITMAVAYSFFNAMALAIFSVFSLAMQMILKFRNRYIAIVAPVILLYAITYVFDASEQLLPYDIRIIIQPLSANYITSLVTGKHFLITFGAWLLVDAILVVIGIIGNKDIL